jgi:hypothetical protein
MARKSYRGEDALMSPETGNWNVASDYSKLKIMKHLYLADEYEIISTFGASSFIEELQMNHNPDALRIRAFRRLVKTLIMLIDNSIFAIKDKKSGFGRKQKKEKDEKTKTDRQILKDFKIELQKIYRIIEKLFYVKKNSISKTKELIINKKEYEMILDRVIEIKSLINEPLNRSDLLFLDKEEFDPRSFKADLLERLATKG